MSMPTCDLAEDETSGPDGQFSPAGSSVVRRQWMIWVLTISLCLVHGYAGWVGVGGWAGLTSEWPILYADHGFHYHHGLVTRHFLVSTGMSAGYDPSFMSGFPMSVVTGTSSTLVNLVLLIFGKNNPAVAFKVFTFLCFASLPWLIALAALLFRVNSRSVMGSVLIFLLYFWADWPIYYADFGMTSYLISVLLGLVVVALLSRYLECGGLISWFWAALSCVFIFLVHLTSLMVIGPATILAYIVLMIRSRRSATSVPLSRHFGLVLIIPLVVLLNSFWLMPGYWLASTAGPSDFVFAHKESVWGRLGEIVWSEGPAQVIVLGLGLIGLAVLARRSPVAMAGLAGLLLSGFGWGYLAGAFRFLDPLQPGRHTFTCYTAACLASGIGLDEILTRLRLETRGRLDRIALVALLLIGLRVFGAGIVGSVRKRDGVSETFLSSRPTPRLIQVVDQIKKRMQPGERLLFEETGFPVKGESDPYDGRHLSPILPHLTGIEVLGGPYLHTPVLTNFTQFGEGKLFGRSQWDRDFFIRYAKIYRPAAICCWTSKARRFCHSNPDLFQISEDDGTILFARVIGFEGATIRGTARVEASPNQLVVSDAVADRDGLVVLRYHYVPYLASDPPVSIEPVIQEDDPVPFIGLRPSKNPVVLRLTLPPVAWWKAETEPKIR